ncbi:MAG: hypothetical protein JWQ07_115 [Ramlibacter sp.]|nr:hypothetical protein [Ramlibacter sp.]
MNTSSRRSARTFAAWPVVAGALAFIVGILMLAGAAYLHSRARILLDSDPVQPLPAAQAEAGASATAAPIDLLSGLPPYRTHTDDVSALLKIASQQAVTIRSAEYRSDASPSLPVVFRVADIRMDEEYPRIKAFVAETLKRMPHVSLDEIRIDQASASAGKLQVSLRLSFAYRAKDE